MRLLDFNTCLLHLAYFLGLTTEERAFAVEERLRSGSGSGPVSGTPPPPSPSAAEVMAELRWGPAPTYSSHSGTASDFEARLHALGLSEASLAAWASLAHGLQRMTADYKPQGRTACAVDVFHAAPLRAVAPSREVGLRDHLGRWADFCGSPPAFHEVGGAHYTMLGPGHVEGFAGTLKAVLRARGV